MKCKFATVNLETADPHSTKRFYIDALGMVENVHRSQPPGFVYLESEGADMTLAVPAHAPVERQATSGRSTIELGFEIDDLGEFRAHLEALGYKGFVPQSMGWGEVLEGEDPDHRRVIVYCFR